MDLKKLYVNPLIKKKDLKSAPSNSRDTQINSMR